MRIGAVGLLAATLAGAAWAAAAPKTMKFTMNTTTQAQGMHVNVQAKVWVKGQKARLEMNPPTSGPILVLVNGKKLHNLFPQRKQGTVSTIRTPQNGPDNPWEFLVANVDSLLKGAKKVGQQKLDGYTCDIYQKSGSREGETMTLKSWITRGTKPRLPIKVEQTINVKRPNMTMQQTQTTRMTGIQMGVPIPDSLFNVPAGYKIVQSQSPGLPGVPGGPGMGGPGMRP
jgi:outer membrane lipoprotein-sorting protein